MTNNLETPLSEHLREFKYRFTKTILAIFIGFIISYYYADEIFAILSEPLNIAFGANSQNRRLIYTSLPEAFMTEVKIALYGGFILAFPVIAWQIYGFIAPALYKTEKKTVIPYLLLAPILFFIGASIAYFFILPAAWKFFISFEETGNIQALPIMLEAKIGEYLSITMRIIMAFGLAFQLPIILTLAVRAGLLSITTLQKSRRWAVIILISIAAIITPPDIVSQIGLFLPLYLLYELSIIACQMINKKN